MLQKEITNYLDWKATYAPKAAYVYRLHLERFNKFIRKEIGKIVVSDVVRFQYHLQNKYAMANVAFATIILKNFFQFHQRQGEKILDPWLIKVPKFSPRPHNYITKEEFDLIDTSLGEREFWELQKKLICRLLWETGMRVSELCAMNVTDINSTRAMAVIETRKNRQLGWCMWSAETHVLMIRYVAVRICLNQEPPLFIARENGRRVRVTERTVQRWIKELVTKVGIQRKISPHSFRHGKAHEIHRLGGNPADVKTILRHRSPLSSFAYLEFDPSEQEKIMKRFL